MTEIALTPKFQYVQSKVILKKWRQLALKSEGHSHGREVTIALVGKYVQLEDAYLSVIKGMFNRGLVFFNSN